MEYVEPALCIANCFQDPVCKCLKYHFKIKDYVENFKRITGRLNSKMEDIERKLELELRHAGKVPKKEVEDWLNNVKEMISGAQEVENKVYKGRYLKRGFLGKLVEEKTQATQEILDKAPSDSDSLVIDDPNAGLPLPTSELIGEKVARDQIWSCLMQEEEVSKIGVWGMGGVGKTTIMEHIYNDLLKEKRFDKVIWVTISQEFNIVKLQDDIARELNLIGDLERERETSRRRKLLFDMLKKANKHVLILDDVWHEICLEEVGIPEPTSRNGCKLVVTTRKERVCKFIGCDKVIKVNPLSEDDALALFLKKVGPQVSQSPTLMSKPRPVVKECAGLPLTIVVVAGTLKGEDDPHIWDDALNELRRRKGKVEGMEAKVIECLQFSFDHLKDEKVKHCFLYCALYPEDFPIRKKDLIECWIDEGFIDEMDTRHEMKINGCTTLKKLEDNSLLETARDDNLLKMHDAVRDMALSIITSMNRPRCMIKAGMQLTSLPKDEEWTADIEKVSVMRNSISEIPIHLSLAKCQLLTTMLLQHNPIRSVPDPFFSNMPCLSVLNLSWTEIECLPDSISELKNLTALLLQFCRNLRHLPSLSKLLKLKKLDLSHTRIEEVPEGMEMLVSLTYLDLYAMSLKEVPSGLLPKLSRLQYLRFDPRVDKASIKAEEVVPLEKLEFFWGSFKDTDEFKNFVQSMPRKRSLNEYHLKVGSDYWMDFEEDKGVAIGQSEIFGDEILLPIDVQRLGITECNSIRSLNDISCVKNAVDLRNFSIRGCRGIEFVLSSSSILFQSLQKLSLANLPGLNELIKVEGFASAGSPVLAPKAATFSHLKTINIEECSNIKKLFLHWLLTNLQNLEEIYVEDCEQLVEILTADDDEEKGTGKIKVYLPKLRHLELKFLPELKSICSKSGVLVCDSLECIKVVDCKKLKRIPPFLALHGNGQPYAYAPPSLKIRSRREWWESLEWDHPNFKNVLQPLWQDPWW
ncbi:hypothetical protein PTKIN_Ptkin14bG0104700 [Pterospermum kingtungense]